MTRLLVTGATGFVGRHLTRHLVASGHRVRALVRSSARASELPREVEVVEAELGDAAAALHGIEVVLHLAARAHVLVEISADPEAEFERVNVTATEALVRASVAAGVRRFVLMSSVGAMASASDEVLRETTTPRPDTPYGRSKLRAEAIVRRAKIDHVIVRSPLVYGPDNPGNMQRLVALVKTRLPLPFGLVANRRSLVYVGNLASALEACAIDPRASGETFLIDDGAPLSTPELIRMIGTAARLPIRLVPVPIPLLRGFGVAGELLGRVLGRRLPVSRDTIDKLVGSLPVDSSHLRARLGWTPPITVQRGLCETLRATRG